MPIDDSEDEEFRVWHCREAFENPEYIGEPEPVRRVLTDETYKGLYYQGKGYLADACDLEDEAFAIDYWELACESFIRAMNKKPSVKPHIVKLVMARERYWRGGETLEKLIKRVLDFPKEEVR